MTVRCHCTECKYNDGDYCDLNYVTISNEQMTAAGMLPICMDYEEDDDAEIH